MRSGQRHAPLFEPHALVQQSRDRRGADSGAIGVPLSHHIAPNGWDEPHPVGHVTAGCVTRVRPSESVGRLVIRCSGAVPNGRLESTHWVHESGDLAGDWSVGSLRDKKKGPRESSRSHRSASSTAQCTARFKHADVTNTSVLKVVFLLSPGIPKCPIRALTDFALWIPEPFVRRFFSFSELFSSCKVLCKTLWLFGIDDDINTMVFGIDGVDRHIRSSRKMSSGLSLYDIHAVESASWAS